MRVAVLEISIHRHVGGFHKLTQMREHPVTWNRAIRICLRPGESGTGAGQGLEAQRLQKARAADVPGIRNDEAPAAMQVVKQAPFVGNAWARHRHHPLTESST